MFSKSIVLSDAFLDMPATARCLYFTLNMYGDDDGFVNSPKAIMRQCGSSDDDMKILIAKKYLIPFESGIIVIKDWRINNYLRSDRYQQTKYTEEKSRLSIEKNGSYRLIDEGLEKIETLEKSETEQIVTEDIEISDVKKIELEYLRNYKSLYISGVLVRENPIINWAVARKLIRENIDKLGFDLVLNAIQISINNEFCIKKGYSLTTILSTGVMSELVNSKESLSEHEEGKKEKQYEKLLKLHPSECPDCKEVLVDTSGVKTSWMCPKCRSEWFLRKGTWEREYDSS